MLIPKRVRKIRRRHLANNPANAGKNVSFIKKEDEKGVFDIIFLNNIKKLNITLEREIEFIDKVCPCLESIAENLELKSNIEGSLEKLMVILSLSINFPDIKDKNCIERFIKKIENRDITRLDIYDTIVFSMIPYLQQLRSELINKKNDANLYFEIILNPNLSNEQKLFIKNLTEKAGVFEETEQINK